MMTLPTRVSYDFSEMCLAIPRSSSQHKISGKIPVISARRDTHPPPGRRRARAANINCSGARSSRSVPHEPEGSAQTVILPECLQQNCGIPEVLKVFEDNL